MDSWQVLQKQSGQSLQVFLKEKMGEGVSGKHVKRLIDAGKCRLNGRPERFASRLVGTGDKVELDSAKPAEKPKKTNFKVLNELLYEDDDIIAYNKPSGISSDNPEMSDSLQKRFGKAILLHRLDKETTGVLLFARNEKTAQEIETLFKNRKIEKTYLALVNGVPQKKSGIIQNYLGKLHVYHGQSVWGEVPPEQGMIAKTAWETTKNGRGASLITCHPTTGRTHQIRVHLSGLGHPILGDNQYGRSFTCSYPTQRILLHAAEITFEHPKTKQSLTIKSPLPDDFVDALKCLIGNDG